MTHASFSHGEGWWMFLRTFGSCTPWRECFFFSHRFMCHFQKSTQTTAQFLHLSLPSESLSLKHHTPRVAPYPTRGTEPEQDNSSIHRSSSLELNPLNPLNPSVHARLRARRCEAWTRWTRAYTSLRNAAVLRFVQQEATGNKGHRY